MGVRAQRADVVVQTLELSLLLYSTFRKIQKYFKTVKPFIKIPYISTFQRANHSRRLKRELKRGPSTGMSTQ